MTPIENVIAAIESKGLEVKRRRDGIWAQCPAHHDNSPSLKLWESDDGACCLKCFSGGCTTEQIMHSIGLAAKDRFLPKEHRPKRSSGKKKKNDGDFGPEVRSHWYHDEQGNKKHVSIKFAYAGWRQKRFDGQKLHWGLGDEKTYLFRLPELLQAVEKGYTIWIPEGEKDAGDETHGGGLNEYFKANDIEAFATTNPMGGGNWKPHYTEWLRGASEIVLVRDPDETGFKRMKLLFTNFTSAGFKVRCVQAANIEIDDVGQWVVKDAYNHLERGGDHTTFETVDPNETWKKSGFPELKAEMERRQAIARGEDPPELRVEEGGKSDDYSSSVPPPEDPAEAYDDRERPHFDLTDLGNARRFVWLFGRDLLWCEEMGCWFRWRPSGQGGRWERDRMGGQSAMHFAQETIRDIARQGTDEDDEDKRKGLFKWMFKTQERARIEAMIALAKKLPDMGVTPDDLDKDDLLFNVANGTIELDKGILRPARREDLITKMGGFAYDKDATCPQFKEWLMNALAGDKDTYRFMWKWMGYSLTGSTREESFLIIEGPGGTGKGTFLAVMQQVMGDYSRVMRWEAIRKSRNDQIPADLADLRGARWAPVDETGQGEWFDEGKVKAMTDDRTHIKVRFMKENFFDMKVKFKLGIATNHKPNVRSFGREIVRRLRLVEFHKEVDLDSIDPKFKTNMVESQGPGVFAEMVRAAAVWWKEGLGSSEKIRAAVEAYQEENDPVGRFLFDCCEYDPFSEDRERSSTLFKAYQRWAKENNAWEMNSTVFGNSLKTREFTCGADANGKIKRQKIEWNRDKNGIYYVGLFLKPEGQYQPTGDPRNAN